MYKIRSFRSRKPLEECSPAYRARRINCLNKSVANSLDGNQVVSVSVPQDTVESSSLSGKFVDNNDRFSASDGDVQSNGVVSDDENSVHESESADEILDSESSSSDESNDLHQDNVEDFERRLAEAFTETNMTHVQAKAVLQVIRSHQCFSNIRVDPRSILKTPVVSAATTSVAGGEYLHLGVETTLLRILQATDLHLIPDILLIDLNTDGAYLDKNSKIVMGPIQIRIPNIPESATEVVGIYRGSGKPSSAKEFFKQTVEELLVIFQDGIVFCGVVKPAQFWYLTAGSPARSFALGHRGHNSTAPCSRCSVRGRCLRAGVMVYEGIDFAARTEEEYSSRVDDLHHNGPECPIDALPINLMSSTVLDYMHLICLGIMEKIFQGIIDGKFSKSAKLSSAVEVQILTSRLEKIKEYCPDDFARKSVNVLKHGKFKATEHRQILLYSGPVIFYGLLNSDALYKHFLLLHVAIRIIVNPLSRIQSIDYAKDCIKLFVQSALQIYGIEFLSYNLHALLHLADDVTSFGSLDSYSAFPYENNMSYFRKLCRKPNQPLQQISNRRAENCQMSKQQFKEAGVVDPALATAHILQSMKSLNAANGLNNSKNVYRSMSDITSSSISPRQPSTSAGKQPLAPAQKKTFTHKTPSKIGGVKKTMETREPFIPKPLTQQKSPVPPETFKKTLTPGPLAQTKPHTQETVTLGQLPQTNPLTPRQPQRTNPLTPRQPPQTNPLTLRQPPRTNPLTPRQPPRLNPLTPGQPPRTKTLTSEQTPRTKTVTPVRLLRTQTLTKEEELTSEQLAQLKSLTHKQVIVKKPATPLIPTPNQAGSQPTLDINVLNVILENQGVIIERIGELELKTEKCHKLLVNLVNKKKLTIQDLPKCLPFKTTQDLVAFNDVSDEVCLEVVNYLQHIGGVNHDDAAALYFKKCFSIEDDDLPKNVTWHGCKTKEVTALKDTRFAIACESAMSDSKQFEKPSNTQFATAMTKALKSIKEDYRRKKAKRPHTNDNRLPVENIQQPQNKRPKVVPGGNIFDEILDSDGDENPEFPDNLQDLFTDETAEPSETAESGEEGEFVEPAEVPEVEQILENNQNEVTVQMIEVLTEADLLSTNVLYENIDQDNAAIVQVQQGNKENLYDDLTMDDTQPADEFDDDTQFY